MGGSTDEIVAFLRKLVEQERLVVLLHENSEPRWVVKIEKDRVVPALIVMTVEES